MCAWGENDFRWLLTAQAHGQSAWLDTFNNHTGEDNQTDSWANRSATYTGCLSQHDDGSGDRVTMGRNSNDNNMWWYDADDASAIRTKGGC
jgi:hypothetical protein